jgi:hypothetical protein
MLPFIGFGVLNMKIAKRRFDCVKIPRKID